MLASRLLLFAGWQRGDRVRLFPGRAFKIHGMPPGLWLMVTATLTNIVCIILLVRLYRREDLRYWVIFRFQRGNRQIRSTGGCRFGSAQFSSSDGS